MTKETALALIEEITRARETFDAEIKWRAERLAIRESWHRLSLHHHEVRRRFERRFGKQERREMPTYDLDDDWRAMRLKWDDGTVRDDGPGIMHALREHPALSGIIATDKSTGKIMLRGPLPLNHWEMMDFEMRPFTKADATAVHHFLQHIGMKSSFDDVGRAIKLMALENAWRPATDGQ
jgi:hypothetical protein